MFDFTPEFIKWAEQVDAEQSIAERIMLDSTQSPVYRRELAQPHYEKIDALKKQGDTMFKDQIVELRVFRLLSRVNVDAI